MLTEWSQNLSVNIAEIDEQNKLLIAMINWIGKVMMAGFPANSMEPHFKDLLDLIAFHFGAEEELMEKHDFPDIAIHREEHHEIAMQAAKVKEIYYSGNSMLSAGNISLLGELLINHIQNDDKKYCLFLNEINTQKSGGDSMANVELQKYNDKIVDNLGIAANNFAIELFRDTATAEASKIAGFADVFVNEIINDSIKRLGKASQ